MAVFTIETKEEFSEFVQSLAQAYRDELVEHGYRPPPYDNDHVCCSLSMMWRAFERIEVVRLSESGTDFEI